MGCQNIMTYHINNRSNRITDMLEKIAPELVHVSGSIETNDYTVQDKRGNYFTFVSDYCCKHDLSPILFISTYECSKYQTEWGYSEVRSVPGVWPWNCIEEADALKMAKKMGGTLPNRQDYDRVCAWLEETGAVTHSQIWEDSTGCGNYWRNPEGLNRTAKTGSNPNWCHNGIYDWFGNNYCWTIDEDMPSGYALRGGGCFHDGKDFPAISRKQFDSSTSTISSVGFRTVIKFDCQGRRCC